MQKNTNMESHQQYENIGDNVLLKAGIITLTGAKDIIGCLLIIFQSQHQLLFTQRNYSSLIESLHEIIMYYKSPLISLLVDMSHSNQMFIGHFIHVVDQLERKISRSEVKRVYIVRPERKSIQKHLKKELGSKRNEDTRINAQVMIVKACEELYQYINRKHLTIDFGGTLEHDFRAWLAVQKMLSQYYILVNNVLVSSPDVLKRISDLTSEERRSKTPEKNAERSQRKRLGNIEKKKNELLRQNGFFKLLEDGQRLNSYFQDPKLNASFQDLSKSPVFEMDKKRFQQYYHKVLTLRDTTESAWSESLNKMRTESMEQELYDRLIECCTWIVERGLPYFTCLPVQSKTLAEAVKQKINFENEFYKPVKVILKKCRQILKEVRHHHRSPRMSSGSLDLMADNLKSLMENLKTKSNQRMEHFRKEKEFMHSLAKAESWCERANDLWPTHQISRGGHLKPSLIRSKVEPFLQKHPPLTDKELEILLDNVENVDDVELRDKARWLFNRCRDLEKVLRTPVTHLDEVSGEELSSDHESSYDEYGRKFSKTRVDKKGNGSPVQSKISTDSSRRRWHDEVVNSTTISNEDATSKSRSPGNKNSRLADIQQRLRDQELLHEQLILEEELRELAEGKSSPGLHSTLTGSLGDDMDVSGAFGKGFGNNSKSFEKDEKIPEKADVGLSSSGIGFEHLNVSRLVDPLTSRRDFQTASKEKEEKTKFREKGSGLVNSSLTSLNSNAENADASVNEDRRGDSERELKHEKWDSILFPPSDHFENRNHINGDKTSCGDKGSLERGLTSRQTRGKSTLPSHVDLLDGCNSLKRLCKLEDGLPQSNKVEAFETHKHVSGMPSHSGVTSDLPPNNNVTIPLTKSVCEIPIKSGSDDVENFSGNAVESVLGDSREKFYPGFTNVAASSKATVELSTEAVEMITDSRNSPRDLESRSHDPGISSRDFKSFSRESRESENMLREERLKNATEAVRRWTQIKNEQRARLTQVIDNEATRKEIEEAYFNAQIQLCRARQDVAKLSKLDNSRTSLPLNNDVMNYSLTSSLIPSLGTSKDGRQILSYEGAFRRFVRNDDSVEPDSNSERSNRFEGLEGKVLDNGEPSGILEVTDSDEKEMVIDGEDSLGITGDVEHGIQGKLLSSEISADFADEDRVSLQENDDKSDSEQESSDEFDDVEEEELMLLCSQSSSGLLSQDELKDNLKEQQEKLEVMFQQQKEQLRMEREKLMEEEKRMNEWERGERELKEENVAKLGENLNGEESQEILELPNTEKNSLGKINDYSLKHKTPSPQHELPSTKHDILSLQHEITSPQNEVPLLLREIPSPRHEIPSAPRQMPSPPHEMPLQPHEEPTPQHEILLLQHEMPSPQHEIPPMRHELPSAQREIPKQQNEQTSLKNKRAQQKRGFAEKLGNLPTHKEKTEKKIQERETNLHERGEQNSYLDFDKNIKDESFPEQKDFPEKTVDENMNIGNGVNDLNEIFVSNFDSGEGSRGKIEDELISILQDGASETEDEKFEDRRSEIAPIFPPLEIDGNHPSMMDDNDDIDLMNQLIDDLMISDSDEAYRDDRNMISVDSGRDHRIDVDDGGINGDGSTFNGVNEGYDGISEGSIEVDIDNDRINFGELGVNEVDIDLRNLVMNADNQEVSMNNDLVNSDISGTGLDNTWINGDDCDPSEGNYGVKRGNVSHVEENGNDSDDFRIGAYETETKRLSNEGLEIDVDIAIDLDNDTSEAVQGTDLIGLLNGNKTFDEEMPVIEGLNLSTDMRKDNSEAVPSNDLIYLPNSQGATSDDDKMVGEKEAPLNEGLVLDVDFNIDLEKDNEVLQANDLIDLLRHQNDAFSSEESLDVDDNALGELDSGITETSDSAGLVRTNNDSEGCGMETLGQEGILSGHHLQENAEDVDVIDHIKEDKGQSRISGYINDENLGHPLIHERPQVMSGDSDDDDFGRVLEDITEEESEYEDLMRYRGTQVNSNDNVLQEPVKNVVPSSSDLQTARLAFHNMDLTESATGTSFTSSIIIDPGTGYCKAGFSIDDQPRVIIPSVVGTPRSQVAETGRYSDFYVGREAKDLHQVLNLHNPLKNGVVQNWELMEKLLEDMYEELRCESEQYPVLLSEPVLNPKSKREEMIQLMFETFRVPAAYSCAQAVLSLFATGRTTGLVYDCGYSKTQSVPVYEGYAIPHATNTAELAGHELSTCLSRMLRDRGVSMETLAELDVVQDIKEKLCYVVVDYDNERKAYNTGERNDTTYTMPDGQTVAIGSERFRCPEVLFTPSMVGMATDGVHEVIYKTALQCAIDVRSSLFQNIVISGGSTMFPGFVRRLHVELCKLLGARTPDSVNIDAVEDRNVLTWQGGAMLSKLSNFQSMWITSSEYEEFGPGIVHKKCV